MKLQRFMCHALTVCLLALPAVAQSTDQPAIVLTASKHTTRYATSAPRDKHGRIARSAKAKRKFRADHPCPATGKARGACPGYVIDHVKPLKRGGADRPDNMQWQTKEAAKAKDRTE